MSTSTVTAADLQALKAAGFVQPPPTPLRPPRISVASRGKTKRGKTHWAILTPPDPVAVISLDPGTRQVVDRAVIEGRTVFPFYLDHSKREDHATAIKLWDGYRKALRTILSIKSIRTLVIDTESDAWDLIQIKHFGKLSKNGANAKFQYPDINAEYAGLVDEVYYSRPDMNTVYIRKVKENYVDDKWDGKSFKPSGYKGFDYLVDLSITHQFLDKQFGFVIDGEEATRFGGEFSGLKFLGDDCSFLSLATHIFNDKEACRKLGFSEEGSDPFYWGMRL